MQQQRYLVVGLAKTGTTVISKTIQNTCGIRDYVLEPKTVSFFETFPRAYGDAVVKILFDHWRDRPHLLDAILANELRTDFARAIFITRDPRAEIVSRLHYAAFHHFQRQDRSADDAERWLEIFRRKEAEPESVSLRDIVEHLRGQFGVFGRRDLDGLALFARRYAQYVGKRPFLHEDLVRYEDFIAGRLHDHPCAALFSGSREVGGKLERTKRSGGEGDWASFVLPSDEAWLNEALGPTIDALGYGREIPDGPKRVAPGQSSLYVEGLINEALERRAVKGHGRVSRMLPAFVRRRLPRRTEGGRGDGAGPDPAPSGR